MSKYDFLDARSELEQSVSADLADALTKRGFTVTHNGTAQTHAPGGLPDIVAKSASVLLTIEVTKSRGAAQDRELNAIRDHLNQEKAGAGRRRCFCVYVAPETTRRMLDGIRDNNQQRAADGARDLKILPLSFDNLEMWASRLADSEADLFPVASFLSLFDEHPMFIDDLRIRKLLLQHVFPNDRELSDDVRRRETEHDQRVLENLIRDLAQLEDYMRQGAVAVAHAAIDNLIFLVFLKLYEEKREQLGRTNRLRSVSAFEEFRDNGVDARTKRQKRAIHRLFADVKLEREFVRSRMFTEADVLADSINDDFIVNHVIPVLEKYTFVGTRIDALGAVYEVLAMRAAKDVKVGQFFTPENVVRFMVDLAELSYKDVVLDPACGTGRFLIYAMREMLDQIEASGERDKPRVRRAVWDSRLVGSDIDIRIAKIAKMNMWVHGDGKTNIYGGREYNGLLLHHKPVNGRESFDGGFDVVLTNPPLGDLNYQGLDFARGQPDDQRRVGDTLRRMPILPNKNLSAEQALVLAKRLEAHQAELIAMQEEFSGLERAAELVEYVRLQELPRSPEITRNLAAQRRLDGVRRYSRLSSAIPRKDRIVSETSERIDQYLAAVRMGRGEVEITGNNMKGGALFINAIWHYLNDVSDAGAKPEWRGGKMLIVLDEGILNTDNYESARRYLREHFYIKAVISLTRDTFVPISKTTTKTSIVYAVKKADLRAVQKEPIFFAHVANVGVDTKGKVCQNDLGDVLERYRQFKTAVNAAYAGNEFRLERLRVELVNAPNA